MIKIKKLIIAGAAAAVLCFTPVIYTPVSAEEAEEFSIDGCIAESDCIIYADYKGVSGGKYKFEIIRMLKGSASGRYVYVTASDEFGSEFVKDTNYVLFLERTSSVYYQNDKYTPVLNVKFIADEQGNITGMTINGSNAGNLPDTVTVLTKYIDMIPSSAVSGQDYIRSTSVRDVINGSPVIVKASADIRLYDYEGTAGVYECSLISAEKGSVPDKFSAALFDRKVSEGEEYYLLFSGKDTDGVYILSSKNSVVSADNEDFERKLSEE